MKWFKKYKIVKISDIHYDIMKRKCLFEWEVYRSFINKHQAECTLYRLNSRFSPVFTHYCSIKPKNKEYVIDQLIKMGYITSCTFDARQKYIYTSQNGYIYSTNDDNISKLTANKYDTLYGIYCSDMDDLFLAIAAINERNDYMQWFQNKVFDFNMCPLPDHRFLCDQDTLEHFGWVNNSPYSYTNGIHNKMSIESIIEMFYEKEKNNIN
jgi:hypothetical protein